MLLLKRCITFRRFSTKAEIRKTLETMKNSVNRSEQVSKIHQKFADYEKSLLNEGEISEEYAAESMLGEKLLKSNNEYGNFMKKREVEKKVDSNRPISSTTFPLSPSSIPTYTRTEPMLNAEEPENNDRGFYVEAGVFVDEYIAGCSLDLDPGDNMISSREYYGAADAVEHISFQRPGQKTNEDEAYENAAEINEGEMEMTGAVDEFRPSSDQKCGGCGANFHCKDPSLPGFVPIETFEKVERKKQSSALCKRCHLLQKHDFLLNVNVCDVDYSAMLASLQGSNESLILLIVDVTDLPGSIHPRIAEIIGSGKPMIVVGNKIDLLPPDAECGYMGRFKKTVEQAAVKRDLNKSFNVLHTALISAKTGFGVEELITQIYLKYTNAKLGMRGDVYIIGCTNSGKSTLFNALLQSDLCKIRAIDLVDRATASIWPGTTMNLLKFPVMKPSPYRLEIRRRRLLKDRAWLKKEMYSRKLLLMETGDSKYAVPIATIQNSFKESEDELQPMALTDLKEEEVTDKNPHKKWSIGDAVFTKGNWCFDTPGTVTEEQVLNLFTLDELVRVVPRRLLIPRTAILKSGESILIGGVARIDILETKSNVLLTTFASDVLPLNVMDTADVDGFLSRYLGTPSLVVPSGNEERMKKWMPMKGRKLDVFGRQDTGCCDVILSSIGWVMVSSENAVKLEAFTPDGRGITVRRQPILPFAAKLRGKRIPGNKLYKVKPIEFPVNERREIARRNRNRRPLKEKQQ